MMRLSEFHLLLFATALLITGLGFSAQSIAQTPVSKDIAATFVQNCKAKRDQTMTKSTQEVFCECTGHFMQENMTVEDMQNLQSTNPNTARVAANTMLVGVYAPCMEFPVRDLIHKKCMANDFQSKSGICDCLADNMAKYTAAEAQNHFIEILQDNPMIYDPMAPIVNSPKFAQQEKKIALSCIQGNL